MLRIKGNTSIESVSASSKLTSVPITVRYNFSSKGYGHFFLSTGFNAVIITHSGQYKYSISKDGVEGNLSKNYSAVRSPKYFSGLNVSAGYETKLSNWCNIKVEPYYQAPINDFGVGRLPVSSFGIDIGIGVWIRTSVKEISFGNGRSLSRPRLVEIPAGVRWKMAPQWVLDAVLPTPRLEYELNRGITLYVGANVKQTNFRVSDRFGDEHQIPRLNHAILSYSEIRTGAGLDWKILPIVTATAEVGYQPYRNFDFYRADVRYHEDGGAPYGMISLHGAF